MYRIVRYDAGYVNQWNEFVGSSINSTFLFHRDFMEYHSDRFTDFSLIVFDGTNLVALLPANRSGNEVHSHQGLTYGGLLLRDTIGVEKIETIFRAVLQFLEGEDIAVLKIKQIVSIYQKKPAFAMDYLLFKYNAHMYRRDMNLAIDFSRPPSVSRSKKKHFRRVSSLGLEVRKDNDFGTFWDDVLIPRLQERHNAKPVHTKDEIAMLHEKFPDRILQYNVYINDAIVAGITLFHFGNVIKSQYGATTAEGEKVRALDYLFISLIEIYKDKVNYFDMGTVNENEGRTYNSGLLKQKEELGCTVYPLDYYSVDTCVATDESIEQLP